MVQGNQACGMSRGGAIGLLITGKIFFLVGLSCLIAGTSWHCDYWYYYDPQCQNLTTSGSVIMVIGIIMVIVGASFYRMARRNPVRAPVTTTYTTQVAGAYPQAYPNADGSYPSAVPGTTTGYPVMPGTTTGYPGMPSTTTGYPGAMPGTTTGYPAAMPGMTTAYPSTGYQTSTNYPPNNDYPPPPPYSAYSEQPGQVAAVPYPQSGTQGFPNEQNVAKVHGYPQQPEV